MYMSVAYSTYTSIIYACISCYTVVYRIVIYQTYVSAVGVRVSDRAPLFNTLNIHNKYPEFYYWIGALLCFYFDHTCLAT